ncbi:MAG: FtsX-like permease family protein, partial [Candidatus Aminicenantes bacterium]|nr:FtsX-like permease family protein [Candidatus Aminicenantes bacterium]
WVQTLWKYNMVQTYVLLDAGVDKKIIDQKIAGVVTKHNPETKTDLSLVPLKNCYLYNIEGGGRFQDIYLFSFVALFILIIAGINYINLSTVRSEKWSKQIAVKKVLGASKRILVKQFLLESVFFTYISMLVALILTIILLPTLNRLFNSNIQLQYFSFHLIIIILLPLFIGLLAGIYPAFILSSTKPLNILGSNFRGNKNKHGSIFRNALIIFQFALSVIMVIFGSIIYLQNQHFSKQNLGYEKDNLLVVDMAGDLRKSYNTVKEELLKIPEVKGVSYSNNPITHRYWTVNDLKWDDQAEGQNITFGMDMVGYDLDKVLGIKMSKGRFLSKDFSTDATKGVVINEEAVKKMNLTNPIGSIIRNIGGRDFEIIGVMKNFHTESLHQQIKPHLYVLGRNPGYHMYLSLNPGHTSMSKLLSKVGKKIKAIVPADPFAYSFLDSALQKLYHSETITGILINFSTIIILIISCLGLIGLAFYTTGQRVKEISIRKVLGGSVSGIVLYLTKNIMKLVLIANVIAWPVAWMVANNWLQNYAYKINLGFGTFILAGFFSFSIALLAVSYQTFKAANINPAECLKRV